MRGSGCPRRLLETGVSMAKGEMLLGADSRRWVLGRPILWTVDWQINEFKRLVTHPRLGRAAKICVVRSFDVGRVSALPVAPFQVPNLIGEEAQISLPRPHLVMTARVLVLVQTSAKGQENSTRDATNP